MTSTIKITMENFKQLKLVSNMFYDLISMVLINPIQHGEGNMTAGYFSKIILTISIYLLCFLFYLHIWHTLFKFRVIFLTHSSDIDQLPEMALFSWQVHGHIH